MDGKAASKLPGGIRANPLILSSKANQPRAASRPKKAARELRQSKSDDRCCLPALAGLVCLQSVVPDGTGTMEGAAHLTNDFS